jgi:hypothetical protein
MTTCLDNNPLFNTTNGVEEYYSSPFTELYFELSDIPAVRFEVDRYTWTLPDGSKVWVHARNEYAAKNVLIDLHQRYHQLQEILQRHIVSGQSFTLDQSAQFNAACVRVLGVPLHEIPLSFASIPAKELADGLTKGLTNGFSKGKFEMHINQSVGFN